MITYDARELVKKNVVNEFFLLKNFKMSLSLHGLFNSDH